MIHCTVPPHQANRATVHATVSEFWYVLEGHGEIWRDNGLESCVTTTSCVPSSSSDKSQLAAMRRRLSIGTYSVDRNPLLPDRQIRQKGLPTRTDTPQGTHPDSGTVVQ
jgi:hypothetical protein